MWQQIHINCTQAQSSSIEDSLLSQGCLAITYQDAGNQEIFEPKPGELSMWQHTKLTALFSTTADINTVMRNLQMAFPDCEPFTEQVVDQTWERVWLNDFKPMQFGTGTWIFPTGFEATDPTAINILLDPGLAFGTGTHATTALCLTWIDQHELKNKTVIDYGCGSGILAIAALKHGAKKVIAVDYDPPALLATRQNAERNDVDLTALTIVTPDELLKNIQADIIIANILAEPLVELMPQFAKLLKPQGQIVLSGILSTQQKTIRERYQPTFTDFHVQQKEEWVLINAAKMTTMRSF